MDISKWNLDYSTITVKFALFYLMKKQLNTGISDIWDPTPEFLVGPKARDPWPISKVGPML